jgi:hypothetical protein
LEKSYYRGNLDLILRFGASEPNRSKMNKDLRNKLGLLALFQLKLTVTRSKVAQELKSATATSKFVTFLATIILSMLNTIFSQIFSLRPLRQLTSNLAVQIDIYKSMLSPFSILPQLLLSQTNIK